MSRFPLTRTPSQAAMLARCLFGQDSITGESARPDGDNTERPRPQCMPSYVRVVIARLLPNA